jgi:hypothetical protein
MTEQKRPELPADVQALIARVVAKAPRLSDADAAKLARMLPVVKS